MAEEMMKAHHSRSRCLEKARVKNKAWMAVGKSTLFWVSFPGVSAQLL
jgi:hypothetical protein